MADVIIFKRRHPQMQRNRPPISQGSAEIVIFPGVRYSYHAEPAAMPMRAALARQGLLERAE